MRGWAQCAWMAVPWVTGGVVLGLVAWPEAGAHRLPHFPQVRMVETTAPPGAPLSRWLLVEIRDPEGTVLLSDAVVTVRARHATLGSGLRTEAVRLAPAEAPGTYRGEVVFPQPGRWALTLDVVGRFVGDAHVELDVAAPLAPAAAPPRRQPDLPFDWVTLRHLVLEWGHLAGFALWLVATVVGLGDPGRRRLPVLTGTWGAFAIETGTGLYKMEYGTPFATPLRLFSLERVPRVFFADDYVRTLVVKHVLMLVAMTGTLVLTVHAWRRKPGEGIGLWRALLGLNLLLALAIAGAAAVLGLYHAIVLHFS